MWKPMDRILTICSQARRRDSGNDGSIRLKIELTRDPFPSYLNKKRP